MLKHQYFIQAQEHLLDSREVLHKRKGAYNHQNWYDIICGWTLKHF